MASHAIIAQRRNALIQDLRVAYASAEAQRDLPLSQRELSARYGLSGGTVSQALKQLVEEGVLNTVPRVGTFLGRSSQGRSDVYLLLGRDGGPGGPQALSQAGFEKRIGQLGGSSIALN